MAADLKAMIAAAVRTAQGAATSLVVASSWVGPSPDTDDDRDPLEMLTKNVDDALAQATTALEQITNLRTAIKNGT